jgi:hypothetical protein
LGGQRSGGALDEDQRPGLDRVDEPAVAECFDGDPEIVV